METIILSAAGKIAGFSTYYSETFEFNLKADTAPFPAIVLLPLVMEKGLDIAGQVRTSYKLQMFFLDTTTLLPDIQTEVLPIMQTLEAAVNEFIVRLTREPGAIWKEPISKLKYEVIPAGDLFDAGLAGYYLTASLPEIVTAVCV